jgi:hypothetical protein
MKKKCKKKYFDKWDMLLITLFISVIYIVYMTPKWELMNPSIMMIFVMTISDKIIGWFIFGIILKKVLYQSEKQ